MKILFLFCILLSSSYSFADRYEKEVSYYNGFGGTGARMRTERIFIVNDAGIKEKLAERILVDSTNEVREMWTPDQGSSDQNNIVNQTVWRNLQGFVDAKTKPVSIRENNLENCTMSADERKISCPHGEYVKSGAVNDSLRNAVQKELPASDIQRANPNRVREE